ncbi:hypothetical protein ACFFWC_06440 [Plantactinospora siamensis]|uniref:Transposase n=1 Tax=Plantactinospora siamensis TaxID=555372 RepID=A0ABV6NWU7_9ACTN
MSGPTMPPVSADLVERLYAAPPDGFVAARNEAVAAARAAGDPAAAREIGALRKPTVAAWLVNLLALRRPDLVGELVELAEALRSAQRDLRGPRLRELSAQRRDVVSALVAEARSLARAADPGLAAAKLPLAEVEATLTAALSDVEVAQRVRSGRLVRGTSYAGFGEVPRPQLRLVTGGPDGADAAGDSGSGAAAGSGARSGAGPSADGRAGPGRSAAPDRAAERQRRVAELGRQRRELTRELTTAQRELRRAESEVERAATRERAGAAELAEVEAQLAELERRRAAVESELGRRKLARKGAERAVVTARRRAGEVEGAIETLDADIADARR